MVSLHFAGEKADRVLRAPVTPPGEQGSVHVILQADPGSGMACLHRFLVHMYQMNKIFVEYEAFRK